MSSFVRRLQRAVKREGYKNWRDFGSKVGVHNEEAADLIARKKREDQRTN